MDITESNYNLIQIGNAVIIKYGIEYYVIPRTTQELRVIFEYSHFTNVDDAYDYAIMLESNWKMYKTN